MTSNQYSVLYDISLIFNVHNKTYTVDTSNITSVSMLHNYDTLTFPICRFKLECDLSLIQDLLDYPDEIEIICSLDANIYQMFDNSSELNVVGGAKNMSLCLKGYIENKNIPTNVMDQYDNGIKRETDLNVSRKVPIDIYGYHQNFIYGLKRLSEAVYHNITIQDIIEDALTRQSIQDFKIQVIEQQTKFDQVLIPNLDIIQMLAYFDQYYGMYSTGAQVYGDLDNILYITSTDTSHVNNSILGIRVADYKSDSDMGGLQKNADDTYTMNVLSTNVSVLTETDIERILNSDAVNAVNVNTEEVQSASLKEMYPATTLISGKEGTPNILHKHTNPFVATMNAARVKEKITQVDLSCNGMDIGSLHIDTRINLMFDNALRGADMSGIYRMCFANHVLTPLTGQLFTSTSTFRLCKNN